MKQKLKTILLLDDNTATNYINKKFVTEADCATNVLDFRSGKNALKYLKSADIDAPELIFVDINMPIMSAWEFLKEFEAIQPDKKTKSVVILLTTSLSPADEAKLEKIQLINEIRLKPLSVDVVNEVLERFFVLN